MLLRFFIVSLFIPLFLSSDTYYQFLKFANLLKNKSLFFPDKTIESCYKKNCLSKCDRSCDREALGCASRSRDLQSKAIACFRAADRIVSNQKDVEDCLYKCDIEINGIDVEIRKPILAIRGRDNLFTQSQSVEECWVNRCADYYVQCDDDDECRKGLECAMQNGKTRFQRSKCVTMNKSPLIEDLVECVRECDLDSNLHFTDKNNADV